MAAHLPACTPSMAALPMHTVPTGCTRYPSAARAEPFLAHLRQKGAQKVEKSGPEQKGPKTGVGSFRRLSLAPKVLKNAHF